MDNRSGYRMVGRQRKRWVESMREIFGYRDMTVGRAEEIVYVRNALGRLGGGLGVLGELCAGMDPVLGMPRLSAHLCYGVYRMVNFTLLWVVSLNSRKG